MSKFTRTLVFEKPEVIGVIPPELLDNVTNFDNQRDEALITVIPPEVEAVASHIGKVSGKTLNKGSVVVSDKGVAEPDWLHRAGADEWHIDGDSFTATSVIPTEFLVGEFNPANVRDKSLLKEISYQLMRRSWYRRPNHPYHDAIAETLGVREEFDDEIREMGLNIWQAEPYEIVHKPESAIHRSPFNRTNETVQRVFFSVIFD